MPKASAESTLYYGDNLEVLKRYLKDESVDLIYLDPPFKSNQDYNVLFADKSGTRSAAQIKAFEDTWRWDQGAALAYQETVEAGGKVSQAMQAFRQFLGENDMLAYLSMMAPRLVQLRRVLKSTGSIYLHCDPTASHYLKLLMDAVFGPNRFRNEIIWKRTAAHSSAKRWNVVHDVILLYAKGDTYTWNDIQIEHSEEYEARFRRRDKDGRPWTDDNLTAPGVRNGDSGAAWRGYNPSERGAHWKVNLGTVSQIVGAKKAEQLSTTQKLDLLYEHGFILWPKKGIEEGGGYPRFKRYLSGGRSIQDVMTDIPPINSQAQERLGYPTQKPEALLERIIKASSNEGDTVLDPFCGCGTAIAAAQNLKRNWIGIDITHLAITLIKHRLQSAFGKKAQYKVIGEPRDIGGAKELAASDPYQFQWWALGLVGARPAEQKKGADQGIDGRLYFFDEHTGSAKTKQIIFSVKAGHVSVAHVRDLWGVVDREKAQIGVLISMEESTQPMRTEAAKAGFYEPPFGGKEKHYPRLQLLTITDLLKGKEVAYPAFKANLTFKAAPKADDEQESESSTPSLF